MSKDAKETPFYVCPNNCEETWFYQDGNVEVRRKLTEEGETMEDDSYDFTPKGPIKCYKCEAEAIIKKKKTVTTETIE